MTIMLKVGIEGRREMIVTRDNVSKFMESGGLEIICDTYDDSAYGGGGI